MPATTITVDRDTLAVLLDAARKWADELDVYIIPAAEESSAEDAAGYRAEAERLENALEAAYAAGGRA